MRANGKADLYFHAYFLEKYLKSLSVLQDKVGSAASTKSKKSKKAKKSARTDTEAVDEDDGQSGTGLEEEEAVSFPPGEKIDIFTDKFPFMRRIVGLSSTLSKVIVNIKKFPFHEKMYLKYAHEFGQR
jgi:hypothetical protein